MTLKQRMNIYLSECSLHAEVLDEALAEAHAWLPLSPESEIGKEMLRVLDQIAYRFGKLQDSMGEKVLPLILEMTEDPLPLNATFAENLNRLERIGAIPDVQAWKRFRAIRNALAHEYPDDPELRTSAINRFVKGAEDFSMLYQSVKEYISDYFSNVEKL